jgi:transglutaminase-like putative cysteine protease
VLAFAGVSQASLRDADSGSSSVITGAASGLGDSLLLEQRIRYSYDRPIKDLAHRLIVIPRAVHGGQERTDFEVSVSDGSAAIRIVEDEFSNCVARIEVPDVTSEIEFVMWSLVTRRDRGDPDEWTDSDRCRYLAPTRLTEATPTITALGSEFAATGASHAAIAEMACGWTKRAMSYGFGSTNVRTTAASALSGGVGVCQDYAHVMLAICRSAGLSARYVSGHLTGEGGSHAWVEVLDASASCSGGAVIRLDPTHDREVDDRYLTIAVGRDYCDVAPTSGTFRGRAVGRLHSKKQLRPITGAEHSRVGRPPELEPIPSAKVENPTL